MLVQTKYIIIQYQYAYQSCKYLRINAYDYINSTPRSFHYKSGFKILLSKRELT